jgi:hypothetical protein
LAEIGLRHFSKDEIYLSPDDARLILKFFFGTDRLPPVEQLTGDDMGFAQALLLEAIDSSYAMSYVQEIFEVFYGKVPAEFSGLKDMIKEFVKKAAKTWFDHASGKDLSNPKIYMSVKSTLTANFRSVWIIRLNTGELTY